jgi:hypothetical protein
MPYTLTEAFKVFELGLANIDSSYGATFWIKIERDERIPNRTAESMRGFWKAHSRNGLELYIRSSGEAKVRYSHFMKNIPDVKITEMTSKTQRMIDLTVQNPSELPGAPEIKAKKNAVNPIKDKKLQVLNAIDMILGEENKEEDVEMIED